MFVEQPLVLPWSAGLNIDIFSSGETFFLLLLHRNMVDLSMSQHENYIFLNIVRHCDNFVKHITQKTGL